MRYLSTGTAKTDFSLAVNSKRKDGQENTIWVNCVMFGEQAERISQYITKGKPLLVQGRFNPRDWTDDDGNKKHRSEFVINQVEFLGSGGQSQGQSRQRDDVDDDLPFD